ncbi:MAG: hypothetical protein ABIY50_10225 [Ignavibacteria bacterium]
MRIYNDSNNSLLDEVEISLTIEEAEDFQFRLNDLANNPAHKYDTIVDDFIEGDVIEKEDGTQWITKSIRISIYTKENLNKYSDLAFKIITKDKL